MRRGSTSRSHTSSGSARPWSGTSTSRSRSTPAPPGGWRSTPCQRRLEACERALVGGLDLGPQRGQRRAAQAAQHLGVAPLALRAAGAQLAAHEVAGLLEPLEHRREVEAVALAQRAGLERAVGAGVAAHEPLHRVRHVGDERLRQAGRRDGAERVAVQAGVLGRDPALLAADAQLDRAPLAAQLLEPRARAAALLGLVEREVADAAQHVVQRVDAVGARAVREPLQVGLDGLQRARVDQLAQLLLAEQLAQQLAVQRQRGGAALGVGLVALVHVRRDVVEQQRARERGGGRRLDLDEAQLAPVQLGQQVVQARAGRARRAGPRGRSRARSGTARSGARPRAATATSAAAATAACACRDRRAGSAARGRRSRGSGRRTAREPPSSPTTRSSSSSGSISISSAPGRLVGVGQVDDDPVVGPDRVRLQAVLLADAGGQREAPGGVHAAAERARARTPASRRSRRGSARSRSCGRSARRASPPAARAGTRRGWWRPCRRGRSRAPASPGPGRRPSGRRRRSPRRALAAGRARRPSRTGRRPGRPGAGVTITRSRVISSIRHVDAPSRNTWPGARLVDHLLVELADAAAVRQVDADTGRGPGSCRRS